MAVVSSKEGKSAYHFHVDKFLNCLVRCHLQDEPINEKDLQQALDCFEAQASYLYQVEIHLTWALLKMKQKRRKETREHLRRGFAIAANHKYDHFIVIRPGDIVTAGLAAIADGIDEVTGYVTNLLATKFASETEHRLRTLESDSGPKARRRLLELRRLIQRGRKPLIEIKTLGGFRVYRGGHVISKAQWAGRLPQVLLKNIICRGPRNVHVELLSEDLWPENPPSAGMRNLKVNLHRLRKTLEPDLDRYLGSSYIHVKDNSVSLDEELCTIDIVQLRKAYQRGIAEEQRGRAKEALRAYLQAAELYHGDFLAEELYLPWVEPIREELRQVYIRVLERIVELYERRGSMKKAAEYCRRAIRTDPLREPLYQKMITLYAQLGMRSEALKAYEQCREVLRNELGTSPSELTESLYRKVLDHA